MPSRLVKSRLLAFRRQGGRCFYCRLPIWLDNAEAFQKRYRLSARQHALRRCTAEHLIAQKDGGTSERSNVVAACGLCNWRRHRGRCASTPRQHRRYVQARVRRGAWLPQATLQVFASQGDQL